MQITLLINDMSTNDIVRVYSFAKVLERRHQVHVVGPLMGKEIYPAYAEELSRSVIPSSPWLPKFLATVPKLLREIRGDLVYAFKPMLPSYGMGLLDRLRNHRPLLLDVEDFDVGLYYEQPKRILIGQFALGWTRTNGIYSRLLMDRFRKRPDAVTVVSSFLQRYYGGTRIPHGADTTVFDPARFDGRELRRQMGLAESLILVGFCGVVHPHKGIEDLLAAMARTGRDDLKLLLVGGARREEYMEELRALGGERLIHVGFQPHERMPEFLAVADAVALPSRRSRHAEAQVPGKVFEAMAMAKPVIATRTSDLPEILEGCGWLVEPNNVDDLTERLSYLCENLDEARGLGERARQRCIEDYSVDAVDRMLQGVLAPFQ